MRKIVASGLAIVAVGVAAFLLTKTKTSTPPVSRTVSDGVVITALQREVSDTERLMEARFWEFTAEMPDKKVSLQTKLELFHKGKAIRYLSGSTVGPSFDSRSQKNDGKPYTVIVGLYPPGGSWKDGKIKALCALKTSVGTFGVLPQVVDFPSRWTGSASGGAVYDPKKKAFLLMIFGDQKKTGVIWPDPHNDDYAVYLTIKKINIEYPKR